MPYMQTQDIKDCVETVRRINNQLYQPDDSNKSVVSHVMNNTGSIDGKYSSTTSLSSHLLNVLSAGIKFYVFDKKVIEEKDIDYESVSVFCSALLLHDLNKFYGTNENTREVLQEYLEEDQFNLQSLFDEVDNAGNLEDYEDDLLYIIQRTELGENSKDSKGDIRSKFEDLSRYCQQADSFVSQVNKGDMNSAKSSLKNYRGEFYNEIQLQTIEKPLLNLIINAATKQYIEDENIGLIVGGNLDQLIYFGEDISENEIASGVEEYVKDIIANQFGHTLSSKVKWNTYKYESLPFIPLSLSKKREIIANDWEEVLERDSGRDEALQSVPSGAKNILPELAKIAFQPADSKNDINKSVKGLMSDHNLSSIYDTIQNESTSHSEKIYTLHYLVKNYQSETQNIENLASEYSDAVDSDLSADIDVLGDSIRRILGIESSSPKDIVIDSSNMCFLCGKEADNKFQPGDNAIYSTTGHSRRAKPYQADKYICSPCQVEYSLVEAFISSSPEYLSNFEGHFVILQNQNFVIDVTIDPSWKHKTIGGNGIVSLAGDSDYTVSQYGPLNTFELVPVTFSSRKYSDSQMRMYIISELLSFLEDTGMKAEMGRLFSRIDGVEDSVFKDTDPIRIEQSIGISEIEDYSGLQKYLLLFDALDSIDRDSSYIQVEEDEFIPLVSEIVNTSDIPISRKDLSSLIEYVKGNHMSSYTKMETVAERGIDLYGKTYDSKHSKTTVFRTVLDAIIDGLSNDLPEEEIVVQASGQALTASERQEYSGNVTDDQARAFVEAVIGYLQDSGFYGLQELSESQNRLVDAYLFAYEEQL